MTKQELLNRMLELREQEMKQYTHKTRRKTTTAKKSDTSNQQTFSVPDSHMTYRQESL